MSATGFANWRPAPGPVLPRRYAVPGDARRTTPTAALRIEHHLSVVLGREVNVARVFPGLTSCDCGCAERVEDDLGPQWNTDGLTILRCAECGTDLDPEFPGCGEVLR